MRRSNVSVLLALHPSSGSDPNPSNTSRQGKLLGADGADVENGELVLIHDEEFDLCCEREDRRGEELKIERRM